MTKLNKILAPVGLVAILAICLKLFCFSSNDNSSSFQSNIKADTSDAEEETSGDRRSEIRAHYKIFSVPLPDALDFAEEAVPLQDIDIRERLDKEFIVNTYWHSQTFLFHKRAHRWFPMIEEILSENGIPEDFKYLALIESGLDNVVSPAGASGFWQFMKATGKSYGLEINKYVDERYNIKKATKAATAYLKNAYKKFNSWTLAAASYNMGMGGVSNRLKEQRTNNYYDLLLNKETSRYVFRILAVKHILTHSKDFGFNLLESDLYPQYKTKTVIVDTTLNNLVTFAESLNTNYKILKTLNPWLRDKILPNASRKKYEILIPAENEQLKPIEQY